jgi:hypothetical protein
MAGKDLGWFCLTFNVGRFVVAGGVLYKVPVPGKVEVREVPPGTGQSVSREERKSPV